ncbi:hypothetical protein KKJ17_18650 [Xenorhabdus bovienii]|uniref:hypothetical protein n=1 Tax=Xenorhabdus bovienii TaxID=40576 RepID=UPI0023B30977|nr:hypothetical protein [Xenorhabdus bovienii]MDE9519680.1 hypothetical protein [Xenorhabdus bovienii]
MEVKEKIATAFCTLGPRKDIDTKFLVPIITKVLNSFPDFKCIHVAVSLVGLKQGKSYRLFIDILHNGESCIKFDENPYGGDGEEFIADYIKLPKNQVSATFNAIFDHIEIAEAGIYEIKVKLNNGKKQLIDENSYYFDVIDTKDYKQ